MNILLMKESEQAKEFCAKLGFSSVWFLERDFAFISDKNLGQLRDKIKKAKEKKLLAVVKPLDEEQLRVVLEKTEADLISGSELINYKDSLHYPKGGLDQILCRIAREKEKIIGFSFNDILQAGPLARSQIIRRIIFNIRLCRKYQVRMFFGNFSETVWEMRSEPDLLAFWQVLGGQGKTELSLTR